MTELLTVTVNGTTLRVAPSTTIAQMLQQTPHPGPAPAIGAVVDNRMSGLNRAIRHNANLTSIDATTREGMEIYRRTANMIFFAALAEFDPRAKVEIGQSFDEGYYFDTLGFEPTPQVVNQLETLMREIVAAAIPLDPLWIPIEEAMQIFERADRQVRVLLLRQMRRSEVPVLTIRQYTGYVHGPVAPNTGMIEQFKLHPHEGGLILEFPNQQGQLAGVIQPRPKLMALYRERKRWNQLLKVDNVAQLNEAGKHGHMSDVIKITEALHEKKIAAIADQVAAHPEARFVFIAGPSSSGKTTFTKRLAVHLQVNGITPVQLSLDNYYVDREDSPTHPNGTYNFESIEALDLPLLHDHLRRLAAGEVVETPIYSFPRGRRIGKTRRMQLEPGQIGLVEGIHGLNDRLSASIPRRQKFKIYVSALTQLCIDDHNRIFTSDSRLLRRMVRDRQFRGTAAADTIIGWPSVRQGESENIFPFQEEADAMFDSALCYEQAVLKPYIERYLTEVPMESPAYVEALRLFRFIDLFIPVLADEIPHTSILREFIGRSSFRY
ncbi:MAG: nucleoside kinase [Deltaproteobacteria bacterium]|nr:nucleoside kinase [Deltaproteobacteria bacterium]